MRFSSTLFLFPILLSACAPVAATIPAPTQPVTFSPSAAFTPIPTFTATLPPTLTPPAPLGTIALDFIALLCDAQWMNGAKHLSACPNPNSDLSGGYAATLDPASEGLPANTSILVMIPSANALFLRYPTFKVGTSDSFRATLRCRTSSRCDVEFALEYYDSKGKYHSPFLKWDFKTGEAPIQVDADLSSLKGQSVEFVLTLRLFHSIETFQQDNGIWIAPFIYRPLP